VGAGIRPSFPPEEIEKFFMGRKVVDSRYLWCVKISMMSIDFDPRNRDPRVYGVMECMTAP
jgi:hypothetical protein